MFRLTLLIKHFFIFILRSYQYLVSPWFYRTCRFQPTCSRYAIETLKQHQIIKAIFLIIKRLAKCHPYSKANYYDPPPRK
ncbi:MAG TPA: membrane protein insertion efficiency factor YidD [Candidatus Megaira endosymbiont of Nemacystus decipiens]|nr:membrane protein insertion efficiency factor YidD [Candidatus Megaera endosymbiont of Nemacystus decipiens]